MSDRLVLIGQTGCGEYLPRPRVAQQRSEKGKGDLRGHGDTFVYNTDRINDKFELICPLGACTAVLPSP
jgi:hypothetical protein